MYIFRSILILMTIASVNLYAELLEYEQIYPIQYKENISLTGFDIRRTFKLDDNNFILSGDVKLPADGVLKEYGTKLLHVKKNKTSKFEVAYASEASGDANIADIYFFRSKSGDLIILEGKGGCESDWGTSVYWMTAEGSLKPMSDLTSVDFNNEKLPQSIMPFLKISGDNSDIVFEVIKPDTYLGEKVKTMEVYVSSSDESSKVPWEGIKFVYSKHTRKRRMLGPSTN